MHKTEREIDQVPCEVAMEIPWDLIKQVQTSLREEAKVPAYDPSLLNLPPLQGSVLDLDPSPPYLRCKHCQARLLRGIQSLNCVFCGRQQRTSDNPPDPIKFNSSLAYKWFLQYLDLDGSEMVGPSVEGNKSTTGQSALQEEIPLCDLLDLEIQWSAEEEKLKTGILNEKSAGSKSSPTLAGVDLENYFIKGGETVSAVSEYQRGTGSNYFQGHENLSLFDNNTGPGNSPGNSQDHENLSFFKNNDDQGISSFQGHENLSSFGKPSETATRSLPDKVDDSFSNWEPDFQSAGPQKVKSVDAPVDSSSDLSAHMDTVFGFGKDISVGKPEVSTTSFVSHTDNWFQGDFFPDKSNLRVSHHDQKTDAMINATNEEDDDSFDSWNDFKSSTSAKDNSSSLTQSMVTLKPEKLEGTENIKDGERVENANTSPSVNVDWIHDDQWKISSNMAPDNKAEDLDYDSFDDWNGFTSSTGAQIPPGSSREMANQTVVSEIAAGSMVEKSFFGLDTDFQSTESLPWGTKSSNILVDSSIAPSAHMDIDFVPENDISDGKPRDSTITSMSNANHWLQDDLWNKTNSVVSKHSQQIDVSINAEDVNKMENANISSINVDWTQHNLWENITNKVSNEKTTKEDNDSFDAWNDFTSSAGAKDASSGSFAKSELTVQSEKLEGNLNIEDGGRLENAANFSLKSVDCMEDDQLQSSSSKAPGNKTSDQEDDSFDAWNDFTSSVGAQATSSSLEWTGSLAASSVQQTSEANVFRVANKPENDFAGLMNPDLFSTAFSNIKSSIGLKDGKYESSDANRMNDTAAGQNSEEIARDGFFGETRESKIDYVEILMSQMHDLSFMLESNLSIPHRVDRSGSFSKD